MGKKGRKGDAEFWKDFEEPGEEGASEQPAGEATAGGLGMVWDAIGVPCEAASGCERPALRMLRSYGLVGRPPRPVDLWDCTAGASSAVKAADMSARQQPAPLPPAASTPLRRRLSCNPAAPAAKPKKEKKGKKDKKGGKKAAAFDSDGDDEPGLGLPPPPPVDDDDDEEEEEAPVVNLAKQKGGKKKKGGAPAGGSVFALLGGDDDGDEEEEAEEEAEEDEAPLQVRSGRSCASAVACAVRQAVQGVAYRGSCSCRRLPS